MDAIWRLGTMGFGYSQWSGVFYPPDLKSSDYLAFYARHFDSVELDTTFYATPPESRVRGWHDAVGDDFRFAAKMPRQVTHENSLDKTILPAIEFVDVMRHLGPKLGVILIQFSPSFKSDQFANLDIFLGRLPRDIRFAIEFRDRSWGSHETVEMLRSHACCFATAEYVTRPREIPVTTDLLYVRWIGEHHRFPEMNRVEIDVAANLNWWRERLERQSRAAGAKSIFGFFNNDYSGFAIETCNQFKAMLGLEVVPTDPDQGKLFE